MLKPLLNAIGFQLGWAMCVIGAAKGVPWAGPAVAVLLLAMHGLLVPAPKASLAFVVAVGGAGFVIDSLLGFLGILQFRDGLGPGWICPPWLLALWMLFATTPELSLRWLKERVGLGALLGGIFGPLSYYAGQALGAIAVGKPISISVAILAAVWMGVMPLMVAFSPARVPEVLAPTGPDDPPPEGS